MRLLWVPSVGCMGMPICWLYFGGRPPLVERAAALGWAAASSAKVTVILGTPASCNARAAALDDHPAAFATIEATTSARKDCTPSSLPPRAAVSIAEAGELDGGARREDDDGARRGAAAGKSPTPPKSALEAALQARGPPLPVTGRRCGHGQPTTSGVVSTYTKYRIEVSAFGHPCCTPLHE